MRRVMCWSCGAARRWPRRSTRVRAGEADPCCLRCGGILKSDTISFGQALVPEVIDTGDARRGRGRPAARGRHDAAGVPGGRHGAAGQRGPAPGWSSSTTSRPRSIRSPTRCCAHRSAKSCRRSAAPDAGSAGRSARAGGGGALPRRPCKPARTERVRSARKNLEDRPGPSIFVARPAPCGAPFHYSGADHGQWRQDRLIKAT